MHAEPLDDIALPPRRAQDLVAAIRTAILSWPCLVLCAAIIAFLITFTPGGLFAEYGVVQRGAIYTVACAAFLIWSHRLLPPAVIWSLRRGWPVALVQFTLYAPLIVLSVMGPLWLSSVEHTAGTYLLALGSGVFITGLSCVLGLLLFQTLALPKLALPITPGHLWRFGRAGDCGLQAHLPLDRRGALLRMEAESQYTRVQTQAGEALLRMTLQEAEALAGAQQGLRVHRSHWVAFRHVDRLSSEGRASALTLKDGTTVPVSRRRTAEVSTQIEAQRTAP